MSGHSVEALRNSGLKRLIDVRFGEAVERVNFTAVIRDWLTLLLEVDLRQSDVAPEQLDAIKSWLEESHSDR